MDKTFCVKTLGCKVNTYESEYIISLFLSDGYILEEKNASVYVINTCTVTNESDKKSRKIINGIRKNNKNSTIIVIGCYTQNLYNNNMELPTNADIILGNKDKSKILLYLKEFLKNKKQIIKFYNINNFSFEDMEICNLNNHTRAFVKIEDGCNNFCSYCVIPYVRGNVRSKNKYKSIKEITSLVNNGYKEIVLTGIHTGQYGLDLGTSLFDLLIEIVEINNLERIRISSIEIVEINKKIISLLSHPKIASHLHLPLQSGSDKILKLMDRRYDRSCFENIINDIRKVNPKISITTDVIVGFPGETDEDFNDTLQFIKKIKFSKIHVFPYSDREGTLSSEMNNKVDDKVKKIRVKELINLSNELQKEYESKFKNKYLEVLIEKYDKGYYYGYSSNYIEVKTKGKYELNKLYNIKYKC